MLDEVRVDEKKMVGDHRWVDLQIRVLASTRIGHAIPPDQAIELGKALIAKGEELKLHNQRVEEEKYEAIGYPDPPEHLHPEM